MTEKRKLKRRAQNIKPSPHKIPTLKPAETHPPTVQTISQKPTAMKNILYCPKTCQQRDLGGYCPPHSTEKACPVGIILLYLSNLCHQHTDRSDGKMKSVYIVSVG